VGVPGDPRSMTRPVCVLSVGRSGTSLVARTLNLLGVHLGPDADLMPPTAQNERGYWENMNIYRVNEQLLEILGGSWYRPPRLTPGWVHDEQLEDLRAHASEVVAGLARGGGRWGFKDPRTIVLLPFWREVIGPMDYVICVRRPQAVIRSVQQAGLPGTEPRATAALWLEMNRAALAQSAVARRTFVFYEDWFSDVRGVANDLAAFVHGAPSNADPGAFVAIESFFDPSLRRADAASHTDGPAVAPELDAMYARLRLAAARRPLDHAHGHADSFAAVGAEGMPSRSASVVV
jgi:hypothetical protein